MLDTLNRRSRRKRQPSGRRVIINKRDLDILSLLYRYRHLTSKDLIAYFQPKSEKRFTERLGQLFHDAGLVDRPKEQWKQTDARHNHIVYTLMQKGENLLLDKHQLPLRAVRHPKQSKGGERKQFLHLLKISQAIHQAELETLNNADQRFVCLDEIRNRLEAKGKTFKLDFSVTIPISKDNPNTVYRTNVKPDGLYGIEYSETGQKLYRFFAIEFELTTPKKRSSLEHSSSLKKKLAYGSAIISGSYKESLGVPNLNFILTKQ